MTLLTQAFKKRGFHDQVTRGEKKSEKSISKGSLGVKLYVKMKVYVIKADLTSFNLIRIICNIFFECFRVFVKFDPLTHWFPRR